MKKRIRFSRPSPALAIACIALFVAMGGVSYGVATGSIDSREIQNGSIRNRDFKDGTLRGQEAKRDGFGGGAIKEITLGKVPSAAVADLAAKASNADNATNAGNAANANNANNLAGQGADQYTTRWALIGADGAIITQTGGFTVVDCYDTDDNCYIDAGEDVSNNGVHAEIATSNTPDAGDDGPANLTGDTSAAPCSFGFITCAPAGTEGNPGVFVVAPADGDGQPPPAGDRHPFYAFVEGLEAQ